MLIKNSNCKGVRDIELYNEFLRRYSLSFPENDRPGIPTDLFGKKEDWLEWLRKVDLARKNQPILAGLEEEMLDKFNGMQGGRRSVKFLANAIVPYWTQKRIKLQAPVPAAVEIYDKIYPSGKEEKLSDRHVYNILKRNSSSTGHPIHGKKNDPSNAVQAIRLSKEGRLYPAMAGYRNHFAKDRAFFITSSVNLAWEIANLYNWYFPVQDLATLEGLFWRSDAQLTADIASWLKGARRPWACSFDVESMDVHMTLDHALWVVDSSYTMSKARKDEVKDCLDRIYRVPVWVPEDRGEKGQIYSGLHTTLSGQYSTNPLENRYNLLDKLNFMYSEYPELSYGRDYRIYVNGDDACVIGRDVQQINETRFVDQYCRWTAQRGLPAKPEKCMFSRDGIVFCKLAIEFGGSRPVNQLEVKSHRSLVKAVYSMLQPEKHFDVSGLMLRACQVLDNVVNNTQWKAVVQKAVSQASGIISRLPNDDEIEEYRRVASTWRERVYGEQWDVTSSPSLTLWSRLLDCTD